MKSRIVLIIIVAFFIGSCAFVYMNRHSFSLTRESVPAENEPAPELPPAPKPEPTPAARAPAPVPVEPPAAEAETADDELNMLLKDGAVPCYKMTLKQLVVVSEARIKAIDKVLRAREDKKTVRELIAKGDELRVEGKFAEARKDYEEALKLATDLMVRREIRIKERLARKKSSARCHSTSCNTR